MIGLLESGLAIERADFRIALADRGSGHGQIHADFGALARELSAEEVLHFLIEVGGDADFVLGSPGQLGVLFDRLEFGLRLLADRTFPVVRKVSELHAGFFLVVDVAAYGAFVFHNQ